MTQNVLRRFRGAPFPIDWLLSDRRETSETFIPSDEAEAARVIRFKRVEDRLDFLHSRTLARRLVASVTGMPDQAILLQSFDDEAPAAAGLDNISISWSRSGPVAAAAASRGMQIAIDVERVMPRDVQSMLGMVASDEESRILMEMLDEPARLQAFYRLWTAKEAVLKWRGDGLRGGAKSVCLPAGFLEGRLETIPLEDPAGPLQISVLSAGPDIMCTLAFSGKAPI